MNEAEQIKKEQKRKESFKIVTVGFKQAYKLSSETHYSRMTIKSNAKTRKKT